MGPKVDIGTGVGSGPGGLRPARDPRLGGGSLYLVPQTRAAQLRPGGSPHSWIRLYPNFTSVPGWGCVGPPVGHGGHFCILPTYLLVLLGRTTTGTIRRATLGDGAPPLRTSACGHCASLEDLRPRPNFTHSIGIDGWGSLSDGSGVIKQNHPRAKSQRSLPMLLH